VDNGMGSIELTKEWPRYVAYMAGLVTGDKTATSTESAESAESAADKTVDVETIKVPKLPDNRDKTAILHMIRAEIESEDNVLANIERLQKEVNVLQKRMQQNRDNLAEARPVNEVRRQIAEHIILLQTPIMANAPDAFKKPFEDMLDMQYKAYDALHELCMANQLARVEAAPAVTVTTDIPNVTVTKEGESDSIPSMSAHRLRVPTSPKPTSETVEIAMFKGDNTD
jgi:hypothetical protein